MAVGGYGSTVYCFDQTGSTWNYTMESGDTLALSLSMSADGQQLAVGAWQRVYLLNPTNMIAMWSHYIGNSIPTIEISENGTYLVAGCGNGNVYLFHSVEVGPPDIFWTVVIVATAGTATAIGVTAFFLHRRHQHDAG